MSDIFLPNRSGALNFCAVALGLRDLGYKARGVRIDSGDLSYLSKELYRMFSAVADKYGDSSLKEWKIVASNDINEDTIISINHQGHKINVYGVGTHLVTCQKQPALGCVYKLVEIDNRQTIKLSLEVAKITIPGRKTVYRLYGEHGLALCDVLMLDPHDSSSSPPVENERIIIRHPFNENKRAYITPCKVVQLLTPVWKEGKRVHKELSPKEHLQKTREVVKESLKTIRTDIKRYLNPTPYKVSVTVDLYNHIHEMWQKNTPIGELK
jgi:nicotinate phosphoribosyltransferase